MKSYSSRSAQFSGEGGVVGVFAKGVQACSDKLLHERESASEKEHGTCKGGEEVVDGGLSAGACSVLSHPGWESTLVFLPSFNPQQAFYLDGPNSTFCQCKQKRQCAA